MKVFVVICSVNRPPVLHRTVEALGNQELRADRVVVSVGKESDALDATRELEGVEVYCSPRLGSSSQRNYGLEILSDLDDAVVVFLDDDVVLESRYLLKVKQLFQASPELMGMSAEVLVNGNVSWEEGISALQESGVVDQRPAAVRSSGKDWICHGCNMAFRGSILKVEQFDENLPLYSYAEDYDISIRVAKHGVVGKVDSGLGAVHLEYREGRVSEFRRGYSIVANNLYFLRKGVCHIPLWKGYLRFAAVIVFKESLLDLLAHLRKGAQQADYWGRFKGRLAAMGDILLCRSHPKRVLELGVHR
ncbi:glycosyltransferase family 2 protein [Pelagicoccus albus]|uniref:Glycosyltransferase n=1 Tax=Pelagicoccus albus TaxID=415222 RepID=A0A7X1B623_9BACT|nr:glycosyltransferase [Pelagicoccus albus]MBC2606267.1 glycosyltransferase [Pelagicoccus albus]